MAEDLVDIDALQMDDKTIGLLSTARMHGLLRGFPTLDSLADGGAQFIDCIGRKEAANYFPDGIHKMLTPEDKAEMDRLLTDEELLSLAITDGWNFDHVIE